MSDGCAVAPYQPWIGSGGSASLYRLHAELETAKRLFDSGEGNLGVATATLLTVIDFLNAEPMFAERTQTLTLLAEALTDRWHGGTPDLLASAPRDSGRPSRPTEEVRKGVFMHIQDVLKARGVKGADMDGALRYMANALKQRHGLSYTAAELGHIRSNITRFDTAQDVRRQFNADNAWRQIPSSVPVGTVIDWLLEQLIPRFCPALKAEKDGD